MLLTKQYYEETKTEKAWFDSSMIIYTKMVEDPDYNYGELFITYKGGSTYVYHKVKFEDYLVFIAGGTDGSHGKTINKIIKGQYEFEKLEPLRPEEIAREYEELLESRRADMENPEIKWHVLMETIEKVLSYMKEEYEKEDRNITNEKYEEIYDYLSSLFLKDIE